MGIFSHLEKGHNHGEEANMKQPFLEENDSFSGLCMVLLCTAVAVCGSFVFGSSIGYSAPAQYAIMDELGLSLTQYSIFGSAITIGAMIGAVTCGRIADSVGRKAGMTLSSVVCTFGWMAIFYAETPEMLYLGRLLIGYGIGIVSYIVPVFVCEIAPDNLRGALGTLNQLFIIIGLSSSYVTGAFVGWRALALLGLVPCVVLFGGLLVIPESPRWLAMSGEEHEFLKALRKLRGPYADISLEAQVIKDNVATLQSLPRSTVMNLFDRANIRAAMVAVGLMAFQQIVGINGIIYYSSYIFKTAGFDPSLGSILYAVLQVIITAVNSILVDRTGRRPLLLVSASGMLMGSLLTAISFHLKAHELDAKWVPILAVTGVLVYTASFSIGMGGCPWLIMSEVFPLHIKGLGGGLVTLTNWFGSWLVSFTFSFLMLWSESGTFFLYAFNCLLAIIFIFYQVPETKGRSLEEIHASLSS